MGSRFGRSLGAAFLLLCFVFPASALAASLEDPFNQWLPDSDAATWTYGWSDSQYAPKVTKEQYSVVGRDGAGFRLGWTTDGLGNEDGTQSGSGTVDYRRTTAG